MRRETEARATRCVLEVREQSAREDAGAEKAAGHVAEGLGGLSAFVVYGAPSEAAAARRPHMPMDETSAIEPTECAVAQLMQHQRGEDQGQCQTGLDACTMGSRFNDDEVCGRYSGRGGRAGRAG